MNIIPDCLRNYFNKQQGQQPAQNKPPLPPRKGMLIQQQLKKQEEKNDPYAALSNYSKSENTPTIHHTTNKTAQTVGNVLGILCSSMFSGTISNARSVYQKMSTVCSIIKLEKFANFHLGYFTPQRTKDVIIDLCKRAIPQLPQITQLQGQYITCTPLTVSDFATRVALENTPSDLPETCLNMLKQALTSISEEDAWTLTAQADMTSAVMPLMTILTISNIFEKIITDRIKSNNAAINLAIGAGITALVSLPFSVSLEATLLAYFVYKGIPPLLHKTTETISKRILTRSEISSDCSVIEH